MNRCARVREMWTQFDGAEFWLTFELTRSFTVTWRSSSDPSAATNNTPLFQTGSLPLAVGTWILLVCTRLRLNSTNCRTKHTRAFDKFHCNWEKNPTCYMHSPRSWKLQLLTGSAMRPSSVCKPSASMTSMTWTLKYDNLGVTDTPWSVCARSHQY